MSAPSTSAAAAASSSSSSSSSSSLPRATVYGSPVSMPSRAVKQLGYEAAIDLRYETVDLSIGEQRKEEFLRVNPRGQVPVLVEEAGTPNEFKLPESSAILMYLCNKHRLDSWYPPSLRTRAVIHQYLHYHGDGIRKVFMPLASSDKAKADAAKEKVPGALKEVERYLASHDYLATDAHPTIADLQLFHELVQPQQAGLFELSAGAPAASPGTARLPAWFDRMRNRPATQRIMGELGEFRQRKAAAAAPAAPAEAAEAKAPEAVSTPTV